jgi:hypothetical protein
MWSGRKRRGEGMVFVPWREPARAASTAAPRDAPVRERGLPPRIPQPSHAASTSTQHAVRVYSPEGESYAMLGHGHHL